MDKKKRNEEIQSRREFFKNAGKKALPILGAVALMNIPTIAKAVEATGCTSGGCYGSCSTRCENVCTGCGSACQNGCAAGCTGGCTGCRYK